MAFYADDEEIWRCPTHPSKRRKTGICPTCLRERLNSLCPDCAQLRPCSCCSTTASSSSSSSQDSSVSKMLQSEPSFRRSRSLAVPFFRSRFPEKESTVRTKSSFFRSVFSTPKRANPDGEGSVPRNVNYGKDETTTACVEEENRVKEERERMMLRSRSVGMAALFSRGSRHGGSVRGGSGDDSGHGKPPKGKGWNFPSPMKALRQSHKASKISQDRSPLYRG